MPLDPDLNDPMLPRDSDTYTVLERFPDSHGPDGTLIWLKLRNDRTGWEAISAFPADKQFTNIALPLPDAPAVIDPCDP